MGKAARRGPFKGRSRQASRRSRRNKATANRVLNYLSAAYSWAGANGYVSAGYNPTTGIERYGETKRERFLGLDELDRLGAAIREAETVGIPWEVDEGQPKAKHTPKADKRQTPISPQAAAAPAPSALHRRPATRNPAPAMGHVDFERAALFLPDSKTGKKTIYLNGPALAVLQGLPRKRLCVSGRGRQEDEGEKAEQPRHDLKRPWEGVRRMAGLMASASMISGTRTRALGSAAGSACRLSRSCSATRRSERPSAIPTLTPIRSARIREHRQAHRGGDG